MHFHYLVPYQTKFFGQPLTNTQIITLPVNLFELKKISLSAYIECLFALFPLDCKIQEDVFFTVGIGGKAIKMSKLFDMNQVPKPSIEVLDALSQEVSKSIKIIGKEEFGDSIALLEPQLINEDEFDTLTKYLPYNKSQKFQAICKTIKSISGEAFQNNLEDIDGLFEGILNKHFERSALELNLSQPINPSEEWDANGVRIFGIYMFSAKPQTCLNNYRGLGKQLLAIVTPNPETMEFAIREILLKISEENVRRGLSDVEYKQIYENLDHNQRTALAEKIDATQSDLHVKMHEHAKFKIKSTINTGFKKIDCEKLHRWLMDKFKVDLDAMPTCDQQTFELHSLSNIGLKEYFIS